MRRVLGFLLRCGVVTVPDREELCQPASYLFLDDAKRFNIAKEIAEQIWREQQLSSSRMTWLLTFQGFLFTGSGFTFSSFASADQDVLTAIRLLIAFGGIVTTIATGESIRASQLQRDDLKKHWRKIYPITSAFGYPRPFSTSHSKRGRWSAFAIIAIITLMWSLFACLAVYVHQHNALGTVFFAATPGGAL